MEPDIAGSIWLFVTLGGFVILGAGFIYALTQWRRRSTRIDPIREAATEELYRAEERREDRMEDAERRPGEAPATAPDYTPRRPAPIDRSGRQVHGK